MSKTIKEIKTKLFTEKGTEAMCFDNTDFTNWWSDDSLNEVAERYAQSQTQELIEILNAVSLSPAFEKAKEQFGSSSPNHWTNKVESVILKYQKP